MTKATSVTFWVAGPHVVTCLNKTLLTDYPMDRAYGSRLGADMPLIRWPSSCHTLETSEAWSEYSDEGKEGQG